VIRDFELPTTETDQQDDQKGERKMWTVRTMGQGQDQKVNIVFETAAGSLDLSVSEALQFAAQILHAAKDITQAQSKQAT
jgi:hypothetical protein